MYRHRFTQFTDALIPVYNRLFEMLAGRKHEAFRRHVLELATLEGGEWLLDVGCGTGMLALRIAAQYPVCTVHGVDISPKWISIFIGGLVLAGLSMIRLDGKRRSGESEEAYYVRNKVKLLRDHRRLTAIGQEIMAARYEADFIAAVIRESLAEFEKLLPELPYIGGEQNPLTGNLVFSASALAFYRVMKRYGKTIEETGELLYRIMEAWIRRHPRLIRRLMGIYYMSGLG